MAIGRLRHIGHIPRKGALKGRTLRSRIDGISRIRDPRRTWQDGRRRINFNVCCSEYWGQYFCGLSDLALQLV